MKVNGVTFSNKKEDEKVTDGTLMVTTHRIVYVKDDEGLEIPLHYVRNIKGDGGWLHSYRIETFLDPS